MIGEDDGDDDEEDVMLIMNVGTEGIQCSTQILL